MKDMITYRHPRTMQQAFGPYTSNHITEEQRKLDWQDKLALWACAATLFVVATLVLCGIIK